jgi:CheY-like chemotaxis protein
VLPCGAEANRSEAPAAAGSTPREAFDQVSLRGLTILVLEDEPDTRDFLRRLLEAHGASVVQAGSAEQALMLFASARPDILVSDIGLPDVDGFDLIQRIRQQHASDGGSVPAIALTAYARGEDRTRALRAGYQAHVAKPVEPGELVATIASFADLIQPQRR